VVKITAGCAYIAALILFILGVAFADQDFYGWFLAGAWAAWLVGATATVRIFWEEME
jgi:hypothetical protein